MGNDKTIKGKTIRIGVLGAGGRMGRAIIAAIAADPRLVLAGAVERAGHAAVGTALGQGLTICTNPSALAHACDVMVDFTSPAALDANLDAAWSTRTAIVVGTTGLGDHHMAAINRAARDIAVLQTANTSIGVTVLAGLIEAAAARLPGWDVEILDLHHRDKRDAPSGTALMLGEAAARGRGTTLDTVRTAPRDGTGPARASGTIGFAALRGGSAAGDHMVVIAGDGERIELIHRAESRDIFATGAVRAAAWLAGKPPGRYVMSDVVTG